MKRLLIFVLLLTFNKTILSQEIKTDTLLTEKQNSEWMLEFKNINSKNLKLKSIKKKVYYDMKFNGKIGTCFLEVDKNYEYYKGVDYNYECKILFLLKLGKKHYLLDIISNPNTFKILNQIKQNNLNNVTIIEGDINLPGICGGINIEINDKKLKRKIKKVL